VVVPVLPRISNHTDFEPLRLHPEVNFHYVPFGSEIPPADLIILPGSKSVRDDLIFLREQGWEEALQKHLRYGGRVLGICGGYQMLGELIDDPHGIEGEAGSSRGFAYLDMQTTLTKEKELKRVQGKIVDAIGGGAIVEGYEIHAGRTCGDALLSPFIEYNDGRFDGAVSGDGQIAGTYWHGLFDNPQALNGVLAWAGLHAQQELDYHAIREASLDRLADAFEEAMDMRKLMSFLDADSFSGSLKEGQAH
jgi:adenosylcobyric acid synthase